MVLDDEARRPGRREGDDTEEAAGPDGVALVRFVVRLQGQMPELIRAGDLGAEGLLGAEDGAAHACFLDGGLVEDEVQGGWGVGDAVEYHCFERGGMEESGRVQGETGETEETGAVLSVTSWGKRSSNAMLTLR